ncbi:uncharacterized protein G2W53_030711 [Senna tora]|uniref:Uncharacterized protein n=1 Tax=Senna tora TaxID=362788 RepID=A0A834WBV0_9FABA|nr:uncharacterized protein G2W53_030711 [Senna tora]
MANAPTTSPLQICRSINLKQCPTVTMEASKPTRITTRRN